uniref:Epididymal-specific lipocalin-9-like isoform X2 n=1 Tax=Callorhinus ursinus TaxID=34884 RepID=A0A3Q7N7T3_CALUR|nr:epididymal-specific lipocalin-9-like isoform X2 [Callorhinus ursinus]
MALLLLSLGLSLVSAQELNPRAIVRKSYDMAKVSGVWYSVSMASDDMKRIEENGDLRVFIRNIESLKDGGLRFHFLFMCVPPVSARTGEDGCPSLPHPVEREGRAAPWGRAWGAGRLPDITPAGFRVHGECVQVAMVCERTERDGEYAVSYEGDNKVFLLETDYKLYITFHLRNIRNGTDTNVLALYDTCFKYKK